MTTAIVLAGGASSRFGGDKLAAALDGRPVLHHALVAVAEVADTIVVVIGPESPEPALPPSLAPRIAIARDAAAQAGPLAGVDAGLAAIRDHHRRIALVVGGDMPALVPDVLRLLAGRLEAAEGLVAMTLDASTPSPLPMALRPAAASEAAAACLADGRRSLRALLDAVPSATLPSAQWRALDPDGRTLRDIDTPGDLEER
jgi:molybdopterin-guanine dinucleotide biosynthesis protein A